MRKENDLVCYVISVDIVFNLEDTLRIKQEVSDIDEIINDYLSNIQILLQLITERGAYTKKSRPTERLRITHD